MIAALSAPLAQADRLMNQSEDRPITHLVCFKFKAPVTLTDPLSGKTNLYSDVESVAREVTRVYYGEAKKIAYLSNFTGGTNNSQEGFPLGYDRCFSMQFQNKAARDYFVGADHQHPFDIHHDAFKSFVGPAIKGDSTATPPFNGGLFVYDFEAAHPFHR